MTKKETMERAARVFLFLMFWSYVFATVLAAVAGWLVAGLWAAFSVVAFSLLIVTVVFVFLYARAISEGNG